MIAYDSTLRFTACLILLILGWLVKVGDIGLRKIKICMRPRRRGVSFDAKITEKTNTKDHCEKEDYDGADYHSKGFLFNTIFQYYTRVSQKK